MLHKNKLLGMIGLAVLALAACDGNGGGPVANTAASNQFGPVFAAAFATDANGTANAMLNPDDITFRGVAGPNFVEDPISL